MKNVAGKVALVTGAAMGMGKLVAFRLARDGAKVVLWDMNSAELDKTIAEIKNFGGNARGYIVDVTNLKIVMDTAQQVKHEVGEVDILVNNAGIVAGGNFLDVTPERHVKVIDVNVNAVMYCTHAFLPDMINKKSGHIVNMASAGGLIGVAGLTSYCASKFAVVGFTEALRMELRKMNLKEIRTTTICPSFVKTGMFEGVKGPMFTPLLAPQEMADKIYNGILQNKVLVFAPLMVKYTPLLKAMSHPNMFAIIGEVLGVQKAMDNFKGR